MSSLGGRGLENLDPADAVELAERALLRCAASTATASCVARHVVDAELAGHPSHGLRLVPQYCRHAGTDGHKLDVDPTVERTGTVSVVDARGGLGYPALAIAVDLASENARSSGAAVCSVIRCGHAGRAGAWAERAAGHGAVGIVLLGGAEPPFVMSAGPGAVASLHTNPVAIGVPARGSPLLLDMATSLVAEGKVAIAASRGTLLPEGAVVSSDGHLSTDPSDYFDGGALLPFAGHKGFGLSAMVEALAVSLTGAGAAGLRPREGALVICVSADAFRATEEVHAEIDDLRDRLHASGTGRDVLAPGEPEARARAASTIMVEADVIASLRHIVAQGG